MTATMKTARGRRSIDATASNPVDMPDKILRKTERSHEENQERAYIAASRRSDRSIEARLQSARMASDIHKRRTGKGFKISEEIVLKEEMYEEEDDEMPRQYRNLTQQFGGTSGMTNRVNAYVSTQVAMRAAFASQVDEEFAKHFPHYPKRNSVYRPLPVQDQEMQQQQQQQQQEEEQQQQQQLQQLQQQQQTSPTSANFPTPDFSSQHSHQSCATAAMAPQPTWAQNGGFASRHASVDTGISPQAISSHSNSPQSNGLHSIPNSPQVLHQSPQMTSHSPFMGNKTQMDTPDVYGHPMTSATAFQSVPAPFTTELPNEVKQLVCLDWNDAMTTEMLGVDSTTNGDSDAEWFGFPATTAAGFDQSIIATTTAAPDYFDNALHPTSHHLSIPGEQSTIGTPGGGAGDSWDRWIEPDSYSSDDPMGSGSENSTF